MQLVRKKIPAPCQAAVIAAFAMGAAACRPASDTTIAPAADTTTASSRCAAPGYFRAQLYGEISADLDWSSEQYECRGMPRPNGAGARLFFAGDDRVNDRRLAFIVAIPEFDESASGKELSSTLTVIDEGSGRFFSTASGADCLTHVASVDALEPSAGRYAVGGAVYCVSPLAEVNGDSSISIAELGFAGVLDWGSP